jgi:hypothetical protein
MNKAKYLQGSNQIHFRIKSAQNEAIKACNFPKAFVFLKYHQNSPKLKPNLTKSQNALSKHFNLN